MIMWSSGLKVYAACNDMTGNTKAAKLQFLGTGRPCRKQVLVATVSALRSGSSVMHRKQKTLPAYQGTMMREPS